MLHVFPGLLSNHKTVFNVFIVIFSLFHRIFHMIDVYTSCCARVLICWVSEVFTAFTYTNITIQCLFFIFIHAQSIFFVLSIIRTWSLLIFIRSHSCLVFTFQLLIFYFFVGVSNFFLVLNCKKLGGTCLSHFIILVYVWLGRSNPRLVHFEPVYFCNLDQVNS